MGNQMPESHKSFEITQEINEPIIKSIVTDLVNAVHIRESIMSDTSDQELNGSDTEDMDRSSYFEANSGDNLYSPFDDCSDQENFKTNQTLVPNRASTINGLMEMSNTIDENDYSPKRSGGSTSVSDWKYSTYSSSNDYSKPYQSVGSKYNDILDSWNLNKEDHKIKPPRPSLMRNFDPLFDKECPSPPERRKAKIKIEKAFFDEHNDSTGLIEDFSKCKIAETPKLETHKRTPQFETYKETPQLETYKETPQLETYNTIPQIVNPKPDVLESAVHQQEINELKQRIAELEKESSQKDIKLREMSEQLDKEINEKNSSLNLIGKLHDINQILTQCSTQMLDEKNEKENKSAERIRQLEVMCNNLMAEKASMEKQFMSSCKKELDNEVITYKVQIKRMEMKVQSLENQLEQKTQESKELSVMVDELISKVHK